MAKDYYSILGVSREASDSELKRAYRKLAREFHPDVNPDPHAQEKFKEITVAYELLSDSERRRIIDAGGDPLASGGGGMGGFGFTGGLGDVFEAFFGGGTARSRGPQGRVRPGEDAHTRIRVTLEECALGVSKDFTVQTAVLCDSCKGSGSRSDEKPVTCGSCNGQGEIQQMQRSILGQIMTRRVCPHCQGAGSTIPDPCHKCDGEGRVLARRTITATIPAGVAHGNQIRLTGQGEVGRGGGGAGDLYVEIVEQEHPMFVRDGTALHVTVKVPMVDAALGASFPLTTVLGEEITVDVPAGSHTGSIITVRSQGMPRLHAAHDRGPLYAHVEVIVPTKLDARHEELLRSFKELRQDAIVVAGHKGDTHAKHNNGFYSKLKNTFTSR